MSEFRAYSARLNPKHKEMVYDIMEAASWGGNDLTLSAAENIIAILYINGYLEIPKTECQLGDASVSSTGGSV